MSQFCKTFVVILFIFTSLATAYFTEDEPSLANENLRLAALGNLNFILEEYGNEINMYDFGELSAGIIQDDSGKSSLYIRSIYGFDNIPEVLSETKWFGGTITVNGIYKRSKQWAVGGSFSGLRRDLSFYSPWEMMNVRQDIINTRDTVVAAFHVFEGLYFGLRGAYSRFMVKTIEYVNYWESTSTMWLVEPSLSLILPGGRWHVGIGYTHTDMDNYFARDHTKTITVPIVFRIDNLTAGVKGKHKLTYRSSGFLSEKENMEVSG